MSALFHAKTFLSYWLDAVDEHSLHSPFLFDFYCNVIQKESQEIQKIEKLRFKLLKDDREIQVEDFGAGSRIHSGPARKISDIAHSSLSDLKFSLLYNRIVDHFQCRNIIELGTSLGINSLYLAQRSGSTLHTFEGSGTIADLAELSFEFAGARNIKLVRGNIDTTLLSYLSTIPKPDLVFMDANHRYEPTIRYFQWILAKCHHKSVIILDDIHYSPEMEKAWNEIRNHELIYLTLDLFRCGIVFLDPSFTKQHVVLQF